MENKKIMLEATIHDVRLHNSKIGDDNWVDIFVRVAGESGIEAAMRLHRAKNKMVRITFDENNE